MRVFGEHEENTLAQLHDVAARAEHAALMADGHLGYGMPFGGVAAYRDEVSVVGVGFDIACGNAPIRTDLHGVSDNANCGPPSVPHPHVVADNGIHDGFAFLPVRSFRRVAVRVTAPDSLVADCTSAYLATPQATVLSKPGVAAWQRPT